MKSTAKNRRPQQKKPATSKTETKNTEVKEVETPIARPRKKGFKYKKLIVVCAIVLVVAIAGVVILPKFVNVSATSTKITTYNVEEITTGSVSTTISGSGTLSPVTSETLSTMREGEVTEVNFTVGDEVEEDDVIAVITYDEDDEEETEEITAPYDGILLELPVSEGDEVSMGSEIAMIMSEDGFTMSISVDETDISEIEIGQDVDITIDAVSGDYTGSVTSISYNGSTSGSVTYYQIQVTVEYVEGVYPGMSVSAEIVIEDSGDGLLVPVDAVHTSGDDSYVYLAPSDAEAGDEYEEDELDLSDLETVVVETGMSDGSYIIVESDDLSEGDLIILTTVTSTQTGSDDDSDSDSTTFGGMGGSFDMGDFDMGDMPQGGDMPSFDN